MAAHKKANLFTARHAKAEIKLTIITAASCLIHLNYQHHRNCAIYPSQILIMQIAYDKPAEV